VRHTGQFDVAPAESSHIYQRVTLAQGTVQVSGHAEAGVLAGPYAERGTRPVTAAGDHPQAGLCLIQA